MSFFENSDNWDKTKERFKQWWEKSLTDRPLLYIVARKNDRQDGENPDITFDNPQDYHLNIEKIVHNYKNYINRHLFLGDSFPQVSSNIIAGSLALYLGCEPVFDWNTVWHKKYINDGWHELDKFKYDPGNYWWKTHLDFIKKAIELSEEQYLVGFPGMQENLDVLAAMRGSQELCYDLIDEPEMIKERISQIDDLFFIYFDQIYSIIKGKDGSSSYNAFRIWGPGKTAKLQCDFSALISPRQFYDFVIPSLRKQCNLINHTMYHLDGPDAIKHVDALMEIKELDALQWVPGDGKPDGGNEMWYPLYQKVLNAGKALFVLLSDGGPKEWAESAEKLIKHFGIEGLYINFPVMDEADAGFILKRAEKYWNG